ncbi:MAG: asparagine--tRNA ligase [Nanoarchaeota archaeon]|nr:asparagine--tRNA ligase [Nanoarchaeota archaeon]
MEFISIKQAMEKGTGQVNVRGWCYRVRNSNKMAFIVLRDSTDIIQCVVEKSKLSEDIWNQALKATMECSLEITGEIKKDERAPTGFEISVSSLKIIGESDVFPITKDQSPEFLLDKRHLWLRSRKMTAILKVRSSVFQAIRKFFNDKGFYEEHSPMFSPTSCEGGSTLFEVKYFDDIMYLTQSWQLYAEAMISALEKIYTISPCFRAEKSKTSRHLSEFWMAETEIAWYKLDDILKNAEDLVAFIVKYVVEHNEEELKFLGQNIEKLKKIKTPFKRITYTQALEILKKDGLNVEWGKDLRTIEEDAIAKHYDKPLIITNYPKKIMAFYKLKDPKNPETALCFDMLAPEGYGEIIGGSERDTDIGEMKKALIAQGEKPEKYEWYFDTRRYGSVPHSGYGLGVERVIAWLCKSDNIKDTIPFPRTMLRMTP